MRVLHRLPVNEKHEPGPWQNRTVMLFGGRRVKRVRWADEQRMHKALVLAVVAFNGVFLALGLLARWGLWNNAKPYDSNPARLHHTIQDITIFPTFSPPRSHAAHNWRHLLRRQAAAPPPSTNSTPIQTFQVDVPILGLGNRAIGAGTRNGFDGLEMTTAGAGGAGEGCEVTLGVNVFANSFGKPLVADYEPPACAAKSNTAVMNLTVTSKGRQFDRLAILYLGDTEIFRTSTEEPGRSGVAWTYVKDMSQYMPLWTQPQKLIFDLPNSVNLNATPTPLNGTFNTTIKASFFNATQAMTPATTIIPISARQSNNDSQPSVFTVPTQNASNIVSDFPRNAVRAVFSVSATGQGDEEFWWGNVLQSDVSTYNASSGPLAALSPFREVQVLIDGQLAGVQWPYPVIFTGGVAPTLWTPIVGIDAFDLKEGEIDISPWLGVLCDGKPHNFSINVVGLDDNGRTEATLSNVGANWQVTGKIFVWLDSNAAAITTGNAPTIDGNTPTIAVSQSLTVNATGFNDTLRYTTSVSRQLRVSGSITTSAGKQDITWTQTLNHTDNATVYNAGQNQLTAITTQGTDKSTFPGKGFETSYSYPLNANLTLDILPNGTQRFNAELNRTKTVRRSAGAGGAGFVSPSGLQLFAALRATADMVADMTETSYTTTQNGTGTLLMSNGSIPSTGAMNQMLRFGGGTAAGVLGDQADNELYFRDVKVRDSRVVVSDVERVAGEDVVGRRPSATATELVL